MAVIQLEFPLDRCQQNRKLLLLPRSGQEFIYVTQPQGWDDSSRLSCCWEEKQAWEEAGFSRCHCSSVLFTSLMLSPSIWIR